MRLAFELEVRAAVIKRLQTFRYVAQADAGRRASMRLAYGLSRRTQTVVFHFQAEKRATSAGADRQASLTDLRGESVFDRILDYGLQQQTWNRFVSYPLINLE